MKSQSVLPLFVIALVLIGPQTPAAAQTDPVYITANPYLGTPLSKYDSRVSPYSSDGTLNRYMTGGGRIYAQHGTYLGRLNANRYDPESVSNPYGRYGSRYSATSINNPYSAYGSQYSNLSANNPYNHAARRGVRRGRVLPQRGRLAIGWADVQRGDHVA